MTPPIKTAEIIGNRLRSQRARGATDYDPATVLRGISLDDLVELERAVVDAERRASGGRLADAGLVYVTLAAAREFGAVERIRDDEEARRELTGLLADAKVSTDDPSQWRMRSRSSGLDITARVKREGRLMIVTATRTRDINIGGRRG